MSYEVSTYPVEKLDPNADIQPGFAFKSERFTDDPDDIPLVKGENVHQGYIDWIGAKHWLASEYDSFTKYHLNPGDVVLAMDRPWVTAGLKWSYIKPHDPKSLLVQRVARLRAKKKLDQDYLRHVISSNYFANYLQPIVTGVNVPHISGKQIGAFLIPIPEPDTQRKIAAILTAYDDLIETNKRRIALLEKMAEELYREWFVRMRFPGHQNTKFVKGVPEGWPATSLGDLTSLNQASFQTGPFGTYLKASEYVDEGTPVINVRNIGDGRLRPDKLEFLSEAKVAQLPQHILNTGDIVFGRKGAVERHLLISDSESGWIQGSDCIRLRLDGAPVSSRFLSMMFGQQSHKEWMINHCSGGATMASLNERILSRITFYVPPSSIGDQFDRVIDPIFKVVDALFSANEALTRTRDLLLPRLISGKLSVEDLDIQFPPSMQEPDAVTT